MKKCLKNESKIPTNYFIQGFLKADNFIKPKNFTITDLKPAIDTFFKWTSKNLILATIGLDKEKEQDLYCQFKIVEDSEQNCKLKLKKLAQHFRKFIGGTVSNLWIQNGYIEENIVAKDYVETNEPKDNVIKFKK